MSKVLQEHDALLVSLRLEAGSSFLSSLTRIVLQMTLAMMTLLALILTGALFWRPVLGMKCQPPPVMGPDNAPVRVSVLHIPPLILQSSSDGKIKGILGEFFAEIIKMCFIKHCNLTWDFFSVTMYNTTQSFLKSIEDSKAEIAFPLSRPLKMWLSDSNYTGPDMYFEDFFKSPGYSLIMDVDNINEKANAIVMQTLLENTWPIIVVTLLFAGISGIFVWMLVRLLRNRISRIFNSRSLNLNNK